MKTFAEIITKKIHDQGHVLRSFWKHLESLGSTMSAIKISKIMRGIQNPSNKEEFDFLMQALNIVEPERSQLEKLAMNFIPPKKPTDEEIIQKMPVMINRNFKDDAEAQDFFNAFKTMILQDWEPEP